MTDHLILNARTWVVKYVKDILNHVANRPNNEPIILEMGYGPSGRPHLGTVTELIRTEMIAKVLRQVQSRPVLVFAFVDDLDGMRKVPANIPNHQMLQNYLKVSLCKVPDPFEEYDSFAANSTANFKQLIQNFGFKIAEYIPSVESKYSIENILGFTEQNESNALILIRASHMYQSGSFDEALHKILDRHQAILDVILPTLGDERKSNYSPFMPISPKTGEVLETSVIGYLPQEGSILVQEKGEVYTLPINGNTCKLQWKVDFGMRWGLLKVDFEMAGKDVGIGTNPIAREICTILDGQPPLSPMYEMFLAEDGSRISKTKGNGISLDDMIKYAGPEVIRHFMFYNPNSAKRLDMKKIPAYIDAFIKDLTKFNQSHDLENPIWYSETGPLPTPNLTASMILNLLQSLQPQNVEIFLDFLKTKVSELHELDETLVRAAYLYYKEQYAPPQFTNVPQSCIKYLEDFLSYISDDALAMQTKLYELGNQAVNSGDVPDLRGWFHVLYKSLLGQDEGPRLGTFCAMYGQENSKNLILQTIQRSN